MLLIDLTTRKQKALKYVDKSLRGVEIGPSYNPLAPEKDGYQVDVIDHASRTELVEKYRVHGVAVENIEEVDFVWKGESFAELTGNPHGYDWAIASHVVEHVPDLVAFLNDCDSLLTDQGVLTLAVPDKRFCFDHYRPISSLASVIDSHLQKRKSHTPGTLAESSINCSSRNGKITWDVLTFGPIRANNAYAAALENIKMSLESTDYVDTHAWCFTPSSFRLIIHDLNALGMISLKEKGFHAAGEFEFFISLSRNGDGLHQPRERLLDAIEVEQANGSLRMRRLFAWFSAIGVRRTLVSIAMFVRRLTGNRRS